MSAISRNIRITRSAGAEVDDRVAVEEPLEIQLVSNTAGGAAAKSISITMRTPGDDEELALGFLHTEGIIDSARDVASVDAVGDADPVTGVRNVIRVTLKPDADPPLDRLERHFYTTSSCGVCGKASLDALYVNGRGSLSGEKTAFSPAILNDLPGRVRERQPVFAETGGLHAAAVFGPDGEIVVVREDVGRHNATDKAIGALLEAGEVPAHGYGLFVSGRASFELMQKSLVAGIPVLVAVGAPSSLAVDTANEFGMTLIGFLRDGNFNIYAGGERII
jgi:FdhD protein